MSHSLKQRLTQAVSLSLLLSVAGGAVTGCIDGERLWIFPFGKVRYDDDGNPDNDVQSAMESAGDLSAKGFSTDEVREIQKDLPRLSYAHARLIQAWQENSGKSLPRRQADEALHDLGIREIDVLHELFDDIRLSRKDIEFFAERYQVSRASARYYLDHFLRSAAKRAKELGRESNQRKRGT
jgi:hypothetical protein